MYHTITPEMLHGAAQMAVMFFTVIIAACSYMFMARA